MPRRKGQKYASDVTNAARVRVAQSLQDATTCGKCGCKLPKRRRVLMQGEGVMCIPCHAKRWGQ